jgi:hypothetical protein
MARLYSNENFPFPVVQELRRLGQDVVTIQDTGLAGQAISDEAVLDFACNEGRALVTLNRKHFVCLHRQDRIHETIEGQANLFKQLIRINRPNI